MYRFLTLPLLASLVALAGCSSSAQTQQFAQGPTVTTEVPMMPVVTTPPPSQQVADARASTDVAAFIDAGALSSMSANSRNQAAGAQFNALQFGRPGAPRNWQGDNGVSGAVVVGPYVRVNSIDCRDFTHTVTAGGQTFSKKGMACRELDGRWGVVSTG